MAKPSKCAMIEQQIGICAAANEKAEELIAAHFDEAKGCGQPVHGLRQMAIGHATGEPGLRALRAHLQRQREWNP